MRASAAIVAAFLSCAASLSGQRAEAVAAITGAAIATPDGDGAAWSLAALARLRSDVDAMFAAQRGPYERAHVGVLAVDSRSGAVLYARNPDDELQTASALKLLAGSVAIDELGPAFRFHTSLAYDASRGALVLRGGGDPFLGHADMRAAAAAVRAASDVTFDRIRVDDRRYERRPYPDGWEWDDFPYYYAPRLSALQFEEGIDTYAVVPGDAVGSPATLALDGEAVDAAPERCDRNVGTLVARVRTGATGSRPSVDVDVNGDGCTELAGSVPLGATGVTVDVTSADPALRAANALRVALGNAAATVVARDDEPPDLAARVLWSHDSESLDTLLGPRFWIPSDNLVAETLVREIGIAATLGRGSTANGITAEKRWLGRICVDVATVTLADGSGLSQYDRATPAALVAILQHDWHGPHRALVLRSLPVGGAGRGSIPGIAGTQAAGRVFAKTGSFTHVRALAGYLAPRRHGAMTFAFLVDDWNGDDDALARWRAKILSRFVDD